MTKTKMSLYNYQTGEFIRDLSEQEEVYYNEISNDGSCDGGAGTVKGSEFGEEGTVYAQ